MSINKKLSPFQKSLIETFGGESPQHTPKKLSLTFSDPKFAGTVSSSTTSLTKDDLKAHQKAVADENPLVKSVLNVLNGEESSIERLAFETQPATTNLYGGLFRRKMRLLPDELLKRISIQDELVSAIANTRSNQHAAFGRPQPDRFSTGFRIEPEPGYTTDLTSDQKKKLQDRIAEAEKTLLSCGETRGWSDDDAMGFGQFLFISARNAIIFGRTATEMIYAETSKGRQFHSFRPIDAGTIFKAAPYKEAGDAVRREALRTLSSLKNKKLVPERYVADEYSWVQVIEGRPQQAFTSEECIVHNFYPNSDVELDGYPLTPLDTVITSVTTHINIGNWNKLYFQNGRASHGMIVVKSDDVDENVIGYVRQQFQASINGVGNCLSGDMSIWTPEGSSTIKDILKDKETKMTKVWTGTEWCDAMVYKTNEQKTLCTTKLGNGITIESSPDHRFRVIGSEGIPVWKKQSELSLGDFVAVNKNNASSDSAVPQINGVALNEDLMEVLGWMTGDGYVSDRSISLYYHQDKERDIWSKHAKTLLSFGAKATQKERTVDEEEKLQLMESHGFKTVASNRIWTQVNDSDFVSKILNLGFTVSRKESGGKSIPDFIFSLPENLKCAFLKGFFSADGNNSCGIYPAITIANKNVREKTRLLLLSIGIRTRLSEGVTKSSFSGKSRVKVNGKSFLKIKDSSLFFEKIGFIQEHKQPRGKIGTNKSWGTISSIANSTVLRYLREVKSKTKIPSEPGVGGKGTLTSALSKSQHLDINAVLRGEDGCSLPRLINYMSLAGIEIPDWMSDFNYEPVVETQTGDTKVQMYDVSVYNKKHECSGLECKHVQHSLMVSGVLLSNSFRTPIFGCGVDDEIGWYPMDNHGRDMEFQYLSDTVARTILSAFQMSPEELPGWSHLSRGTNAQGLGESNNEWRLIASRDVGLRPLLANMQNFLNARILPALAPDLAKFCSIKFVGLEADTAEKESTRLQQDQAVHMTVDEVLEKVEKDPIGKRWGGRFLLNPAWQQIVDKYFLVGDILEHFFGIEGASKDPRFQYVNNPLWMNYQQMVMQQQQMEQQQQAEQQAQQQQAQQQQAQQQPQGQPQQGQTELSSAIDQLGATLGKSEKYLPQRTKKILDHQDNVISNVLNSLEKDSDELQKEILALAGIHLPNKFK